MNAVGLCRRCEHRVAFMEAQAENRRRRAVFVKFKKPEPPVHEPRPRYECGSDMSVHSCYMYQPVLPIVLERNEGDPRELAPGYFSARFHGARVAADNDVVLLGDYADGDTLVQGWAPRGFQKEKVLRERKEAVVGSSGGRVGTDGKVVCARKHAVK